VRNPIARWRKRRALIREAERLETQARSLERSLLGDVMQTFGPLAGIVLGVASVLADHKIPAMRGISGVMMATRGRMERIEELRRNAEESRKEAAKC